MLKVTVPATYIMFDYIAVELNGWFAFANSSYTQVRSWRLGGASAGSGGTAVYFGDGADYWSSPHLCQSVNQTSVSLDQASYPFCDGHFFAPTVIYLYDW